MVQQELVVDVNGRSHRVVVDPRLPLLWVLRDHLRLCGSKFGCGQGSCGACSVLIDGEAYRSCVIEVGEVTGGEKIVTIEGIGAPGRLSALQQAFAEHTAFGCGFCTPGMIINATALLLKHARPTREQIITAMNDNLCRCAAYPNIIEAIESVAVSAEQHLAGRTSADQGEE